jgi:hypothetical protein
VRVRSRDQIDALDDEHIWTRPLIDMRFNYKPENPLYLLLLRVWRLEQPVAVENIPAYAGCKSWVPLQQPIDVGQVSPALSDEEFSRRRERILSR